MCSELRYSHPDAPDGQYNQVRCRCGRFAGDRLLVGGQFRVVRTGGYVEYTTIEPGIETWTLRETTRKGGIVVVSAVTAERCVAVLLRRNGHASGGRPRHSSGEVSDEARPRTDAGSAVAAQQTQIELFE